VRKQVLGFIVVVMLESVGASAQNGTAAVRVCGQTLQLKGEQQVQSRLAVVKVCGQPLRLDDQQPYIPLGHVQIIAARQNTRIGSTTSDEQGVYDFEVDTDQPFVLLFHGEKRVPQMQDLAGLKGSMDKIHVTLLTPKEYQDRYSSDALEAALSCVEERLKLLKLEEVEGILQQIRVLHGNP
jgi:hypothetical protein